MRITPKLDEMDDWTYNFELKVFQSKWYPTRSVPAKRLAQNKCRSTKELNDKLNQIAFNRWYRRRGDRNYALKQNSPTS